MPEPTAAQLYRQFTDALGAGDGDVGRLTIAISQAINRHGHVPPSVVETVSAVQAAWESGETPNRQFLLDAKIEVWRALDAKNGGDGTAIRDSVDRTLWACLCLTEAVKPEEALDSAGWAAEMLSAEPWPRQTEYI
jgi:hypothetical protein